MRRLPLLLLLAASCTNDSSPEQARRGHEIFEPAARALAVGLYAEEKTKNPAAAAQLLQESQAKDEAAFVDMMVRNLLVRYGVILALKEAQAVEFRAGRFDDPGNRKRVDETLVAFEKGKRSLPEVARYAISQVRSGAWSGLNLEFAARLLWAEAMRPRE